MLSLVSFSAAFVAPDHTHTSEVWGRTQAEKAGIVWRGNSSAQSSHELLADVELPKVCTPFLASGHACPTSTPYACPTSTPYPSLPPPPPHFTPPPSLPPTGVHLGRQGRRELSHHEPQPAHPPVLRLMLGARFGIRARRSDQDRAQRAGHRRQPRRAAHPQLRRRGLVPR
jgi:hypothetical protein